MVQPAPNQNQPPVAERGPLDEVSAWFMSVPPVTRMLFAGSMGVSILAGTGIVSPRAMILYWPMVYKQYQIWRILTCFLFFPIGWSYMTLLYFLYKYSNELERDMFNNKTADYVFFTLFAMCLILPLGVMFNQAILLESLVLALVYVWSMGNKQTTVTFFFGIQFKAMYLPWVYVIFDFLSGAPFPPIGKLIGIAVGHLYYFLDKIYPEHNNGAVILSTPQFLVDLVEKLQGAGSDAAGAGAAMGRGHRLGGAPAAGAGGIFNMFARQQAAPSERPIPRGGAGDGPRQRQGYTLGQGNRLD